MQNGCSYGRDRQHDSPRRNRRQLLCTIYGEMRFRIFADAPSAEESSVSVQLDVFLCRGRLRKRMKGSSTTRNERRVVQYERSSDDEIRFLTTFILKGLGYNRVGSLKGSHPNSG